jgi:hypothetical protein
VNSPLNDDELERIKIEIRAEAEIARQREPLPRHDPAPRVSQPPSSTGNDGIERGRLDYAIGELTGSDYVAFVDQAFRALLKRPPDDAGLALQVNLLAGGASKAEALGNLRWSAEGKRIGVRVRGLLPRYALAKFGRAPVLGYFVQWALVFAGLPALLRHQRAADTSIAARFHASADAQRDHDRRLGELVAEHDRRSDAMREDIRRILLRLDELERRARAVELRADNVEHRSASLEHRAAASAHEAGELRHYVHTANHWVASLQNALADLENAADAQHARADELAAGIVESASDFAARRARHLQWSAVLAAHLPDSAQVLDLASGDGGWIETLRARGIDASGVEANRPLVARARQRELPVVAGDPLSILVRCADAGLDGVTLGAQLLAGNMDVTPDLLREARRALRPGGCLFLRVEPEPHRLAGADMTRNDVQHWTAVLLAAGFSTPTTSDATGGCGVLAQHAGA